MSEQVTVMGSRLRLQSIRHLPKFLKGTKRINQQLSTAPGLVDSKLRAEFRSLTFWTLSTWEDEESLRSFARSEPHASVVDGLQRSGAMRSTDFAFWTMQRGEPFPEWSEVRSRIDKPAKISR